MDEALTALGRLRTAWGWLAELREPGRQPTTHRYLTDRQVEAEADQVRRDREAQADAMCGGTRPGHSMDPALRGNPTTVTGPHADAGRPGVIAARSEIAATCLTLAGLVGEATSTWTGGVSDPTDRPRVAGCGMCHGKGHIPYGGPGEVARCPRCLGHQLLPTYLECGVCGTVDVCACDTSDSAVNASLDCLSQALPYLAGSTGQAGEQIAADAHRVLTWCDRLARRTAGMLEDRRRIHARCPACQQRDLWADVSSPRDVEWSVSCHNPLCQCRGSGCGCGRAVRYDGRRHRWPTTEWLGPHGLAARLGVDLVLLAELEHGKPKEAA